MSRVFTQHEFAQRIAKVQAAVNHRGLSALIITRPENIFYLSGFRAAHFASFLSELHALIVPANSPPRIVTRALEKNVVQLQWSERACLHMDHESPFGMVQAIFAEDNIPATRVGIEERFVSIRQLTRLKQALPTAQFQDVTGLIEAIAIKSSATEVNCLRKAAAVTRAGFEAGFEAVHEGKYIYEVIGRIHEVMYMAGQTDFDMAMVAAWAGPKGGDLHDTRATHKIAKGDALTIEIFGVDQQYKVAAQGTVFVGRPPEAEVEKAFKVLSDMFKGASSAIRPGATSGDVYDAANKPYRAAFGSDYFRKVGGSMGLTVFNVGLTKGTKDVLEPGMCLLIQVLVNDPVLTTCSSTVLVTENGYETLTDPILELRTV